MNPGVDNRKASGAKKHEVGKIDVVDKPAPTIPTSKLE